MVELWGLGDLVIATPFLQAASRKYDVTLLAKPYAKDLQARFWPDVRVMPCTVAMAEHMLWLPAGSAGYVTAAKAHARGKSSPSPHCLLHCSIQLSFFRLPESIAAGATRHKCK